MKLIIVADIFGRTEALEVLSAELDVDVEIIDPYNAEFICFDNEAAAYTYFMTHVGINAYTNLVFNQLQLITEPVRIVAFSVGAASIWRLSKCTNLKYISTARCFYGSQIRHYSNITPSFPIELILPASEPHFSVAELITKLSGKANVQITQVPFLHGFMNKHSANYDAAGYELFKCIS
ncbi:hypothetical protein [Aliidiomarina quisquiliarum]|uniref:hypothetical protein n=1 Tax=Aliidiomarina quisquiliarum TaxID=2938947 RepID=UPI00208E63A8|nr:hypothetical protein [Aliidiomarina quisquiliarum]MCO4320762.1 hypothetical protein [Aliidiomarina quisquiliarum]